jgi:hypothetical protein
MLAEAGVNIAAGGLVDSSDLLDDDIEHAYSYLSALG